MLTSGLVAGLPCAAAAAQRPRRALQGAQARPRCAPSRGARLACSASGEGIDPMQGWGGRDVRPGEVESNFGDKVIGHYNTDHVLKIPDGIAAIVALEAKNYAAAANDPVDTRSAELMRKRVLDWKIVEENGQPGAIRRTWAVKDAASGAQLLEKVQAVLSRIGHPARSAKADAAEVVVELGKGAAGGLTERDFVAAASVDKEDLSAFVKPARRSRAWA